MVSVFFSFFFILCLLLFSLGSTECRDFVGPTSEAWSRFMIFWEWRFREKGLDQEQLSPLPSPFPFLLPSGPRRSEKVRDQGKQEVGQTIRRGDVSGVHCLAGAPFSPPPVALRDFLSLIIAKVEMGGELRHSAVSWWSLPELVAERNLYRASG